MTVLSLSARRSLYAEHSADTPIILVRLTHPDWAEPVLLSSDPTERLSLDPLAYGTRSTWQGSDTPALLPLVYSHVLMAVSLPDKSEGEPAATSLIFENVDYDMAAVLDDMDGPATVALAMVFAGDPSAVEEEYRGLEAVNGGATDDRITLDVSRVAILSEPCPADRMTASRFPGLFR